MASLKKLMKKKNYHALPLLLTATNHFEMNASINGVKGRFILDTGASNTCVGMDRIDHFKLKTKASKIKAAGAGATDMDTLLSKKNKLRMGKWKAKKVKLVLFDLAHVNQALTSHNAMPVDGIIGADLLKETKAVIDYGKKTLYLKKQ
ncbi:TIGR02281 family clan AA aspartic protease [Maribacter sp. 2307ULW6-5]|uniref:retropepsin-like aspartic protease family protein n=1 Tax=Maribacter sp. 2307ULW6-5 TaxID=3386275 RepID=UPI0039BC5189